MENADITAINRRIIKLDLYVCFKNITESLIPAIKKVGGSQWSLTYKIIVDNVIKSSYLNVDIICNGQVFKSSEVFSSAMTNQMHSFTVLQAISILAEKHTDFTDNLL